MEGLGIFVCRTETGALFNVKMVGELEGLREYLDNKHKYIGQLLTVTYQNLTADEKIPRFPVESDKNV